MKRFILVFCGVASTALISVPARAQESAGSTTAQARQSQARPSQRDTRRRFGQVATRATANFHAADSIEQRLRADGASLHPQLIALRLQIQSALEETRAAMNSGDFETANEALDHAQGYLDRFARRLGGD